MGSNRAILATTSAAALLAGFLAVDCGGATNNQQCVPGATQVCVGPGACMGGQACRSDGAGFEPCNCGGVPVDASVDGPAGSTSSGGSGSSGGSSGGAASSSGSDSSSGSMPEAGPWDCLGNPSEMYQPGAMTAVKVVTLDSLQPSLRAEEVDGGSGLDILQYTPLPGLQVRACDSVLTPGCNDATSMMWQTQTSDDAGVTNFTLPQNFAGFFQITGPNLFTTLFFPSPFVPGETTNVLPGALLPLSAAQELEQVLPGLSIDLDTDGGLGSIVLSIFDCHDHFAPDVTFLPSGAAPVNSGFRTTIFYTQGSGQMEFPTTSTTATDSSGAGGILNVPVGAFSVRLTLSSGQQIGVVNAFINPGVASAVNYRTRTSQ